MQKKKISESFLTGALLGISGGFLDAYTYVCRGHVFANAQTGNMVLMGMKLAEGEWKEMLLYLIPVAAFGLGVLLSEALRQKFRESRILQWRQAVLLVEILVLSGVGLIPLGAGDTVANVLVSFVCAMQVQAFRKLNGAAYATTMCTGNLRSGTELLFKSFKNGDTGSRKSGIQYFGIILCFIAGAALGMICTNILGQWAVCIGALLLCLVFLLLFLDREHCCFHQLP